MTIKNLSTNPPESISEPITKNISEPTTDFDTSIVQINGPINMIRLEGKIDGIYKVIYLIMMIDNNYIYTGQHQCPNVYSTDVDLFLAENFLRTNESSNKYDFFMNVPVSDIQYIPDNNVKNFYLLETTKFFTKLFVHDIEKNKVGEQKYYKNLRLHHFEIQDYIAFHFDAIFSNIERETFGMWPNIYLGHIRYVIDTMISTFDMMNYINSILSNPNVKPRENKSSLLLRKDYKIEPEIITELIYKIKKKYNHPQVMKVINTLYEEFLKSFNDVINLVNNSIKKFIDYEKMINNSDKLLNLGENNNYMGYGLDLGKMRRIASGIRDTLQNIRNDIKTTFSHLTDIYLLRRFLDKDYVTNAIVCNDAMTSIVTIKNLLHKFDFKITHAAYSSINNMNNLTTEIKTRFKKNSNSSIDDLFFPSTFTQCSDVTHFPKVFS